MRGTVDGLGTPRPLLRTMPSVYWSDFLAERMCASFDDVLAPIFATLDCFPAYLDPRTTPQDMLGWLAGWIGLTVGGIDDPARMRDRIVTGATLLPWRGTARSIKDAVAAAFDCETEVVESTPWVLVVRVVVDDTDDVDRRSVDALVDAVKPAHLPHRVEIVARNVSAQRM